ncbi:hypothetical protein QO010_000150 [Caulobacter ginsengisoli]|uniref:Uncharacterized protein n=1 Tax=Caulobacter ginsengisoli TaxID=400775 RepID=A0ABU0IK66_9CAUL|nr:hypothetical protein [Caulobacter ginsengisoli]MDQ0462402.1 hypothetical protein [Caulobacter ginsengisoli]
MARKTSEIRGAYFDDFFLRTLLSRKAPNEARLVHTLIVETTNGLPYQVELTSRLPIGPALYDCEETEKTTWKLELSLFGRSPVAGNREVVSADPISALRAHTIAMRYRREVWQDWESRTISPSLDASFQAEDEHR